MNKESMTAAEAGDAAFSKGVALMENAWAEGHYAVVCRDKDGNIKWEDEIENIVCIPGKNLCLDTFFAGSAYTVVGPFMGLADTNVASATTADTLAAKTTWKEVGVTNLPTYTIPRKTVTFSAAAAGAKASTGTYTFAMTGAGTVGGCFMAIGTGAVSTVDSTAGILYSVGAFTGGSKVVSSGDSLTVTYTASM